MCQAETQLGSVGDLASMRATSRHTCVACVTRVTRVTCVTCASDFQKASLDT